MEGRITKKNKGRDTNKKVRDEVTPPSITASNPKTSLPSIFLVGLSPQVFAFFFAFLFLFGHLLFLILQFEILIVFFCGHRDYVVTRPRGALRSGLG
ncbi:hypothetical protein CEXT_218151 [Caerostris extrusa]|uniref:Transmembrane protein n=1 Tax=Caerostris extrusa TaxID=172846 RepID=A0AAV4Y512_CAEEX|nr:hypothetical protein CEXT_218151 [Caerostris extrusa]